MRFFELISMLFPILMIILFLIVFIKKSIRNRNNTGEKPPEQPRYAAPAAAENRIKPWLGRFPEMPLKPAAEPIPRPKPAETPRQQSNDSLHIMENEGNTSEENKASEEATSAVYFSRSPGGGKASPLLNQGLENINRLPELKKAVIWAEILGKPKGLE